MHIMLYTRVRMISDCNYPLGTRRYKLKNKNKSKFIFPIQFIEGLLTHAFRYKTFLEMRSENLRLMFLHENEWFKIV